jgi:hypothetical protein
LAKHFRCLGALLRASSTCASVSAVTFDSAVARASLLRRRLRAVLFESFPYKSPRKFSLCLGFSANCYDTAAAASIHFRSETMLGGLIPEYDPVLFGELHELSTFLPTEEIEDSIRGILRVSGIITIFHLILLSIVKVWMKKRNAGGESADDKKAASLAAWKASYQLTNLFVNLTLGCLGIYHTANLPSGESIANKVVGYEHMKMFGVIQVGYQLWALPIGIFFVGELKSMIVHHVAVICVGSISAFVRAGFRYYVPYFYGLIEISSVPLSIMNSFKNNKHWIKAYPEYYSAVRVVFAVSFLLVRVILWTPFYWEFYALESMLLYSSEILSTKVILTLFNLASLILTMLQYFWASKIISALVGGGGSKKKGQ